MGQAGRFLRRIGADDGYTAQGYAHWCPACEEMHAFAVDKPFSNGARWTFNGNFEKPSFAPSMNIRTGPWPTVPVGRPDAGQIDVCHYFLKTGAEIVRALPTADPNISYLQYLGDCTHAMHGQIVPLPELPQRYRDSMP